MYGMQAFFLVSAFVLLTGLFLHGAADSLTTPRMGERDIDQKVGDALYTAGQAVCVGVFLLIVGMAVLS